MMTAHLEPGAVARLNPLTMVSHFPAAMLEASLPEATCSPMYGILVVDDQERIVVVNHRAEHIFGYAANELLDKPLDMLVPPTASDKPHARRSMMLNRAASRRNRIKLHGRRADGSALVLKSQASRVRLGSDYYLALILHDSTPALQDDRKPSHPLLAAPVRAHALTTQQASEMEKRRFSRKLYDDIGQRLSVLKLDLSWLENSLHSSGRHVPARLAEMQGLLDNVITLTKSMASTLRPPVLDDFGLLPAVEWMLESFRKRSAMRFRLEHSGMENGLDDVLASVTFRIIQEALANTERHAHASQVWVALHQDPHHLNVSVRDDGIGLEPGDLAKAGCYGLVAMQERIFALGGTIRIDNARPHGALIEACIPLEQTLPVESHQTTSLPAHDTNRNRR